MIASIDSVVVHGGDAAPEHLDRADLRADVGEPIGVDRCRKGRHLVEHEELEREPGQHPFHQVARRVEVRVDQAGHREQAITLDHTVEGARPAPAGVRPERLDLAVLDGDVRTRPLAIGVVEREDVGVADEEGGHESSNSRPQRLPRRVSMPASLSAFQTGSTVES
jgi:hypothetical protein